MSLILLALSGDLVRVLYSFEAAELAKQLATTVAEQWSSLDRYADRIKIVSNGEPFDTIRLIRTQTTAEAITGPLAALASGPHIQRVEPKVQAGPLEALEIENQRVWLEALGRLDLDHAVRWVASQRRADYEARVSDMRRLADEYHRIDPNSDR